MKGVVGVLTDEQCRRINYNTHTSARSIHGAINIPAESMTTEQQKEVHFYVYTVPFLHCSSNHRFCNAWTPLLQSCVDTSSLACWCNASRIEKERRRLQQKRAGSGASSSASSATTDTLPYAAHSLPMSELGSPQDFAGYSTTLLALEEEILSAEQAALLEPSEEEVSDAQPSSDSAQPTAECAAKAPAGHAPPAPSPTVESAAAMPQTDAADAAVESATQASSATRSAAPAAGPSKYLGKTPDVPRYVRKGDETVDLVSKHIEVTRKVWPPETMPRWANCLSSNSCENHNGTVCTTGWDKKTGANVLGHRMKAQHAAATLFSSDNAEFSMLARQDPVGTLKALREGIAPTATPAQADAARHARAAQLTSRTSARAVQDNPYSNVMGFKMPEQLAISSEERFHAGQASTDQLLKLQARREKEFAKPAYCKYSKAPVAEPPCFSAAALGSHPGGTTTAASAAAQAGSGSAPATTGKRKRKDASTQPASAGSKGANRKRGRAHPADDDPACTPDAVVATAAPKPARPQRMAAARVTFGDAVECDDSDSDFDQSSDADSLDESDAEPLDGSNADASPPRKRRKQATKSTAAKTTKGKAAAKPLKGKAAEQAAMKAARKAGSYRGNGRGADSR